MITEIILDADGVLGNFTQAVLNAHGRPEGHDDIKDWDFYKGWGMNDHEFWSGIAGHEFWYNVELYPWADELYKRLSAIARVTIVTSPCDDDFCSSGKTMWLRKHFNLKPHESFIGGRKELMASPTHLMIDDSIKNVESFIARGGMAILFPQPWNDAIGNWQDVISLAENIGKYASN